MALVTIQRSPTPSNSPDEDVDVSFDNDEQAETDSTASLTIGSGSKCISRHRRILDLWRQKIQASLSECYFAVKSAAIILQRGSENGSVMIPRSTSTTGAEIQQYLQAMLHLLRPQDTLKMAVRLESVLGSQARYMAIVSTSGRQDNQETVLLGVDYAPPRTTLGMVLPVWGDTQIRLDGDGGISVTSSGAHHVFKPVSVQAMWSAFQSLHKEHAVAHDYPYFQGGMTHTWVQYYESRIDSPEICRNEWHFTFSDDSDLTANSLDSCKIKPAEQAQFEREIRNTLRNIMQSVDLDEVTSKDIRQRLQTELNRDLSDHKECIEREMLMILGQMDRPSQIFPYLYLGTEWNASNLEELRENNVGYILNVTKEVDNFFPSLFNYKKIRVSDEESTELLNYWNQTFEFIDIARKNNKAVLVHCKKGISRSSSTVIAYAMKDRQWDLDQALRYVQEKRNCIRPNHGFLQQLKIYEGMVRANLYRKRPDWNQGPLPIAVEPQHVPWLGMDAMPISASEPNFFRPKQQPLAATPPQSDMDFTALPSHVVVSSDTIIRAVSASASCSSSRANSIADAKDAEVPLVHGALFAHQPAFDAINNVDDPCDMMLPTRRCVRRPMETLKRRGDADEVKLKELQHMVRSAGACGYYSDTSSLGSSCDEGDLGTPGQDAKARRNSGGSSGDCTSDSAVGDLAGSSPQNTGTMFDLGDFASWNIPPAPPVPPKRPVSMTIIETGGTIVPGQVRRLTKRLEAKSEPNHTEKLTSDGVTTQPKRKQRWFSLFSRPKNPLKTAPKPGSTWYSEAGGEDVPIAATASATGSLVFPSADGILKRPKSDANLSSTYQRKRDTRAPLPPLFKIAEPGNVRRQTKELEARLTSSMENIATATTVVHIRRPYEHSGSVRRITSDLEARSKKSPSSSSLTRQASQREVVKSLVGVFEVKSSSEIVTDCSSGNQKRATVSGCGGDQVVVFSPVVEQSEVLDSSTVGPDDPHSLDSGTEADSEEQVDSDLRFQLDFRSPTFLFRDRRSQSLNADDIEPCQFSRTSSYGGRRGRLDDVF